MPLREDLLNPIPGDNPGGVNLRYDPITDKIKEARREDLDVPQGEWKTALKTADYPLVIKLAGEAIAKRSKDLQIAVWLVDAHVRREGFPILAPAFQFLRDLIEQFWENLYPPIDDDGDMEVRAAPLDWLGTRLGEPLGFLPIVSGKLSFVSYQESRLVGYENDADTMEKQEARQNRISEGKLSAEQFDEALEATPLEALKKIRDFLNSALEAVQALSDTCDERFRDFSPSFIKTRSAMEDILQCVRILIGRKPGGTEEEEQPAEEAEAPAWSIESDVSVGMPEAEESSDSSDSSASFASSYAAAPAPAREAPALPASGAARQLAAICRSMRAEEPDNPAPYLILRAYAWGRIQANAPMFDHSLVEAPPGELRVSLKRAASEGDWDRVLELTESAMLQPCGAAWLDLQRYTVNALEQKGFPGTAVVVRNSFRLLLEALPEMVDLSLPDDTPAANGETRNWIENFVLIQKATPPPPEAASDSASTDDSFSFDSTSFDSSSLDTPSLDSSLDSTETPSFDAEIPTTVEEPAPEPVTFTVDENPPILDDESAPSDLSDEFAQAMRAIRRGTTEDGLQVITALLATERSERARFRRRTQLAHLLLAAGKGAVARPILDEMCREIEERHLDGWEESEAIAYPLDLLYQCLGRDEEERKAALYARICKLDPVRALRSAR